MSGKGIFVGQPQPGACYGGKALKKCKSKGETGNVIEIDVDSDNYANVIIIDVPESVPKRLRGSSSSDLRKKDKFSLTTIICIDDDDDDDENTEHNNLDEVQFVQQNKIPVNISKCRRTYSGKASTSNHYGLGTYSESALSGDEADGPDFELEGSYGKLKEQWEKAFLKRQNDVFSRDDQDGNVTNVHQNIGIGEEEAHEHGSLETKNIFFNSQSGLGDTTVDSGYWGREMHKVTDEYKRAAELEWASRQRELQIQAEEARHLRQLQKRKMAESSRLLDMERRQKQRVEEMRETQKKDEENLNLKEQLRAEVRKDLNRLETTCHDMASILRGLGISANGGSANEVRLAFKRALLCFHPDRASQSNIRQQVEAEEKFKLINRMKEKFSFST